MKRLFAIGLSLLMLVGFSADAIGKAEGEKVLVFIGSNVPPNQLIFFFNEIRDGAVLPYGDRTYNNF